MDCHKWVASSNQVQGKQTHLSCHHHNHFSCRLNPNPSSHPVEDMMRSQDILRFRSQDNSNEDTYRHIRWDNLHCMDTLKIKVKKYYQKRLRSLRMTYFDDMYLGFSSTVTYNLNRVHCMQSSSKKDFDHTNAYIQFFHLHS